MLDDQREWVILKGTLPVTAPLDTHRMELSVDWDNVVEHSKAINDQIYAEKYAQQLADENSFEGYLFRPAVDSDVESWFL
jgi:hypothetical protein